MRALRRSVDDLLAAHELYLRHAGEFLPVPDPDDLLKLTEESQLYGTWDENGDLVAVGGTFWVGRCRHEGGRPIGVYELAGLVVHPSVRGLRPHGVQDILVALRVVALALGQTRSACVISSVASANRASRRCMERCGLLPLAPERTPSWLRDMRRTWIAGREPDVTDYVVPPAAVGALRGLLGRSLHAVKDDGQGGSRRFAFDVGPSLATDAPPPGPSEPEWEVDVPPQRLLGRRPPFVPWPR